MFIINILFFIFAILLIIWGKFLDSKKKNDELVYKITDFVNKYYKFIIAILFILLIFTSVYKLGIVPYGMHLDEAGMAYDAISLSNYGVDRYLNKYPVYLINYGGGQSAMYAYIVALLVKIFGYSTIIIRVPSVAVRILLSVCAFLIMKDENNKLKNIVFLLLLTISPYFIMQSRWGLDCNLLVGFITISICVFYKAIKRNSNILLFFSGLLFGLSLYTYALSYLIIPLFLGTMCVYLLYIKKINIYKLIVFAIPLAILALPLILMIMVNNGIIEEINSFITIPSWPDYRGNEISFKYIFENLYILIDILSFDHPNIFGDMLIYNASREFGTIYYFAIPFFFVGFFACFKKCIKSVKTKIFDKSILFIALFLSVLACQLLIYQPNINKSNAIFIAIIYFVMQGIIEVIKKKVYIIIPISIVLILNFTLFLGYYFNNYNQDNMYQRLFATYYLDALDYSKNLGKEYVYIDDDITLAQYMYILLDHSVSPYEYNENIIETTFNNKNITYVMSIPVDINYDSVYIVKNDNYNLKVTFESLNFKQKEFGNLTVFYY